MILITGGAGYVGSHFVRTYLKRKPEAELVIVDNLSEGWEETLPQSRVHLHKVEMGDRQAVGELFKRYKVDGVVHFAANAYVGESQENPFKYLQNNVAQTINLFQAMESNNVRRVVFSSTCATYGVPDYVPIDESHPQRPVNVYGMTKYMVEKALQAMAVSKSAWSYVALRYFNAAGADDSGEIGESHDPETHLIPLALKSAKGEISHLLINGDDYETSDGTCIRDYIHVTDLADAHIAALDLMQDAQVTEAINLGTAHGYSVKQIIAMCEEVSGKKIPVKVGPRRSGDPPSLVANNTKAAQVLNWKPAYDLRAIIESAWRWETNRRY